MQEAYLANNDSGIEDADVYCGKGKSKKGKGKDKFSYKGKGKFKKGRALRWRKSQLRRQETEAGRVQEEVKVSSLWTERTLGWR